MSNNRIWITAGVSTLALGLGALGLAQEPAQRAKRRGGVQRALQELS